MDDRISTLTAKAAYSRKTRRKLRAIRVVLTSVDAKLSNAQTTGLIYRSAQLEKAHKSVEEHVSRVEQRLAALRKSGAHDWQEHQDAVERGWEDLYRSIRHLVAHLP